MVRRCAQIQVRARARAALAPVVKDVAAALVDDVPEVRTLVDNNQTAGEPAPENLYLLFAHVLCVLHANKVSQRLATRSRALPTLEMEVATRGNGVRTSYTILRLFPFDVSQDLQENTHLCYILPVAEKLLTGAGVAKAREALNAAAPEAANKMISVMRSGDKDDAVALAAAEKILSINGITAKKEAGGEQAKLVGAAVIAAIAGLAKVSGLRGVTEKTFAEALRNVTPEEDTSDLPPELLEQDTLR